MTERDNNCSCDDRRNNDGRTKAQQQEYLDWLYRAPSQSQSGIGYPPAYRPATPTGSLVNNGIKKW